MTQVVRSYWFIVVLTTVVAKPVAAGELDGNLKQQQEETLKQDVEAVTPEQLPKRLTQLLEKTETPGASVAVVKNGKVIWAAGVGQSRSEEGKAVTEATLFQAASISKPVTALAALRLVQKGVIDLDKPINSQLQAWKVPNSGKAKGDPITLRHILSHTAGLTVHGFAGYRVGKPVPTLIQVLNGQQPANSSRVRANRTSGTKYKYSGGGYCVAQLLIQEKTNKAFAAAMNDLVLKPLQMKASTYQQPLPAALHDRAASGHRSRSFFRKGSVVRGEWHVYPEQAAAGLWTTPSDLARFLIAVQRAYAGKPDSILNNK
ncbi:MAG: serine hydrolase domain-containing protein, partial [Planctomycetaceae bacterium]